MRAGQGWTRRVRNAVMTGAVALAVAMAADVPALGSTSGLFEPYVAYPTGSWPEAVAIGDVTGDRLNDVVLVTSYYLDPSNDYKLFVYRQQADGTLAAPVKYDTGGTYTTRPQTVAIGDVNGDGRNDVVVGNSGGSIGVFSQNDSGGLHPVVQHATGDSQCVRIADLNGDGRLDVAGAGLGTSTVSVFLQDAGGSLAAPVVYAAPHVGYEDLEVGDLDHDGRTDVAVMSGEGLVPNVSVLYQQPDGTLGGLESRFVGANQVSHGIGIGDVTGDGRNDLVASFGLIQSDYQLAVFAQAADGSLPATPTSLPSWNSPAAVEVADVSGDRRADVLVVHRGYAQLGVYVQGAGGVLDPEALEPIPFTSQYNPHALAVGDLDNDGLPDVAIADWDYGLVVLRHEPASPAGFYTVAPCRLVDTRLSGQPLPANTERAFGVIGGGCDVPADARAVSINVTAVDPGGTGHLRLFSWGPPPETSSLNFVAGRTRANNAIVPLGPTGEILVRCSMPSPTATVHLVIDVNGYFR